MSRLRRAHPRSRSRGRVAGLISFAAVALVGAVVLIASAARPDRPLADTLGVQTVQPVAFVKPGSVVCQDPLQLDPAVGAVRWVLNTRRAPGPELELQIREGPRVLSRSRLPGGYGDGPRDIPVDDVHSDRVVGVCLVNRGRTVLDVYGANPVPRADQTVAGAALGRYVNETSRLTLDGVEQGGDASIDFPAKDPGPLLTALPDVPRRAAAWLPDPFGSWFVAVLLLAVVAAGTVGMGRALAAAEADDAEDPPAPRGAA